MTKYVYKVKPLSRGHRLQGFHTGRSVMGYEVFIPYHYIILISSPFTPGILFHDSSYLDQDKSQEHYFLQLLYWTTGDKDFS